MNSSADKVVIFPRNWSRGDYEYHLNGDEFELVYSPEGNIESIRNEIDGWQKEIYTEDNERRKERIRHFKRNAEKRLLEAVAEDDSRIAILSELGISRNDFNKLSYLHENPHTDKIESIYLIRQNGSDMYKIGVSTTPERRLNEVNTGNPYGGELVMYYTGMQPYEREKILHQHFSDERIRKNAEWFKLHKMDLKTIEATFERWLEDDKDLAVYLALSEDEICINKGPFEKWKSYKDVNPLTESPWRNAEYP